MSDETDCVGRVPPPLPDRPERLLPWVQLELRVTDDQGQSVAARVSLRDALGQAIPGYADLTLMSHYGGAWMGEYFYVNGSATVPVPPGPLNITVGRGFEWEVRNLRANVQHDTTIVVPLARLFDLRAEGWFSGDVHVHTAHSPIQMPCGPANLVAVAQAEDLGIVWALDGSVQFSGGPHPLSTPEPILYFSTEWRNQAYGHAALLGLTNLSLGIGCCAPPSSAHPTLSGLREQWNPTSTQGLVLAHPVTGAAFFYDGGWPGWGLGRELPVLASSGNLDALDLASYSIPGDTHTIDWEGLLSCGLQVPPSAGTDAVLNWYATRPPGGYRVYVREDGTHSAGLWVETLRAGRAFVTNGPLIPTFSVDGVEAGSRIERNGPSARVFVQTRVLSSQPPSRVILERNGEPARIWQITDPRPQEWILADSIDIAESCWLTARVEGTTASRFSVSPNLFAQTGAVFVRLDNEDPRSTTDAGRFIDWVDSLQAFVETRGNWPSQAAHADVLARLDASRTFYGQAFLVAPSAFALLEPEEGDTLLSSLPLHFDWSEAPDGEPGDLVTYTLEISADTLFSRPYRHGPLAETMADISGAFLPAGPALHWRVRAQDRGGNVTLSQPERRSFLLIPGESAVGDGAFAPLHPRALRVGPNPAAGPVRFSLLLPADAETSETSESSAVFGSGRLEIFDATGRLVRQIGTAATREIEWDRRDGAGRPVPSGVYYAGWSDGDRGAQPEGRRLRTRVLVLR